MRAREDPAREFVWRAFGSEGHQITSTLLRLSDMYQGSSEALG